ncbi:hypothetical protein HanRHA438_Chr16g0765281 [Helianthus annuus]|uniref:Uncharacterized protein n=1 Tax=Helianthus annuus TaxID=4232 RepID=A0A9K3DRQ6_HELAN|nr:hypothetical protein HanXRQr2_Chr16g0753421 [Helianthus annuus]KAJ0443244.1 hypothetical protein HanIR_Chr16g0818631 [Helianthus annuus]KAJ0460808.1 hypothetical protein HanHA89_Chr16g0665141 [Helianthus annuus]KAJ0541163.1 hypothetical protein HanHA89_Chr09g0325331 [Helianthus annuus]KAJ0641227.1 hypothetical protein HanLR1_Chr16g0624801 [Helianthus annuus]
MFLKRIARLIQVHFHILLFLYLPLEVSGVIGDLGFFLCSVNPLDLVCMVVRSSRW